MNKFNLLRFLLMPKLESYPLTHVVLFLMAFHVFSLP